MNYTELDATDAVLLYLSTEYDRVCTAAMPRDLNILYQRDADAPVEILATVTADPAYPFTGDFITGVIAGAWANSVGTRQIGFGDPRFAVVMVEHGSFFPTDERTFLQQIFQTTQFDFRHICTADRYSIMKETSRAYLATQSPDCKAVYILVDSGCGETPSYYAAWYFTSPDFLTGLVSLLYSFDIPWEERVIGHNSGGNNSGRGGVFSATTDYRVVTSEPGTSVLVEEVDAVAL